MSFEKESAIGCAFVALVFILHVLFWLSILAGSLWLLKRFGVIG